MFYVEQILKNGITVSNIKYVMACGILLDLAMLQYLLDLGRGHT
jgi:hypothetical protein